MIMNCAKPWYAGASLRHTLFVALATICFSLLAFQGARAADRFSLAGTVSSAGEGAMEGVVVIAQREGDTVLTAVTSDDSGRYAFPRDRLKAGDYSIRIRAVGYRLPEADAPRKVTVRIDKAAQLDLTLEPVTDKSRLAAQLTSLEWVQSFPGTPAQKDLLVRNMVNCAFCHSLERVVRSPHTAEGFLSVIQRMKIYETDHSSAERIQIVSTPDPLEGLMWYGRKAKDIADYLATLNLSGGKATWDYPLKTLPRPSGEGTEAVVTVYPIPRQPSVIHDLDVDAEGNVWYGNTGWDYIGKLDPDTGEFQEWEAPNFRPPAEPGTQRILGVMDIQVDPEGRVWAAVGGTKQTVFLPETEQWRIYDLPVIWKNPFLSPVREGEKAIWGTGLTRPPEGDEWPEYAFRRNIETGELSEGIDLFGGKPVPQDPNRANQRNYCYMMEQDKNGNFLCTTPEASAITRADADGNVRMIPTPTPHAYPRRGYRDDQNRFWFTEFWADRIGVIDLDTDEIKEYPLEPRYISPYYARPDAKGYIWVSSTGSDRLLRLDPRTGEVVKYLMPVYYDARKVVVDTSADHTTVWLPNKNRAQLIRVEIPD
jgi:streptogramin lyase